MSGRIGEQNGRISRNELIHVCSTPVLTVEIVLQIQRGRHDGCVVSSCKIEELSVQRDFLNEARDTVKNRSVITENNRR